MPVDILVDMQYGSTGKGLVAESLGRLNHYDYLISVNTAQAGHTAACHCDECALTPTYFVLRHLPAACIGNPDAKIIIGPGAVINPHVLREEIEALEQHGIRVRDRLWISGLATVIDEETMAWAHSDEYERLRARRDGQDEKDFDPNTIWGSTKEGVAQALARRAMRVAKQVRDYAHATLLGWDANTFVCSPYQLMSSRTPRGIYGKPYVLLEGSQGYGLSLSDPAYPRTTSRDCTASAFLSYAGLPPRDIRHVYGVARTFPIRVAGNSGPLFRETTWERVAADAGYDSVGQLGGTITTVTKRVRRVGEWDDLLYTRAYEDNAVDRVILTFINHLNREDEGKTSWDSLSDVSRRFVEGIVERTGYPIWALSTCASGGWVSMDTREK